MARAPSKKTRSEISARSPRGKGESFDARRKLAARICAYVTRVRQEIRSTAGPPPPLAPRRSTKGFYLRPSPGEISHFQTAPESRLFLSAERPLSITIYSDSSLASYDYRGSWRGRAREACVRRLFAIRLIYGLCHSAADASLRFRLLFAQCTLPAGARRYYTTFSAPLAAASTSSSRERRRERCKAEGEARRCLTRESNSPPATTTCKGIFFLDFPPPFFRIPFPLTFRLFLLFYDPAWLLYVALGFIRGKC